MRLVHGLYREDDVSHHGERRRPNGLRPRGRLLRRHVQPRLVLRLPRRQLVARLLVDVVLDLVRQDLLLRLQTVHLESDREIAENILQFNGLRHDQVVIRVVARRRHRRDELRRYHLLSRLHKAYHVVSLAASYETNRDKSRRTIRARSLLTRR